MAHPFCKNPAAHKSSATVDPSIEKDFSSSSIRFDRASDVQRYRRMRDERERNFLSAAPFNSRGAERTLFSRYFRLLSRRIWICSSEREREREGGRQESGLGIHSAAKERHSRALNTFQLMTGVGEAALWFRGIQSLAIKKRVLSTKISPLECSAAAFRSQSENLPSASSVINLRQRTEKADCCPDPPSPSDGL